MRLESHIGTSDRAFSDVRFRRKREGKPQRASALAVDIKPREACAAQKRDERRRRRKEKEDEEEKKNAARWQPVRRVFDRLALTVGALGIHLRRYHSAVPHVVVPLQPRAGPFTDPSVRPPFSPGRILRPDAQDAHDSRPRDPRCDLRRSRARIIRKLPEITYSASHYYSVKIGERMLKGTHVFVELFGREIY